MADIFLSDVHLRFDRPERGRRLARLLDSVPETDRVFVVGDLADFWFVSREDRARAMECPGFASLRAFQARGGRLHVLLGNHDAWLGPFYERFFGLAIDPEPLEVESFGLRLRLEHGHQRKGKKFWKGVMEGRTFLRGFRMLPEFVARALEQRLESVNEAQKAESTRRMTAEYRAFVRASDEKPDVWVFGHVHDVVDESLNGARLIVLGDWTGQSSYLRVDEAGAEHRIVPDPAGEQAERVVRSP